MVVGAAFCAFVACCVISSTTAQSIGIPGSMTFGYTVDVTGSMGSDITYVRQAIYNSTSHLEHFRGLGIKYFILTTFSDPKGLTNTTVFSSLHKLHNSVSTLKATGGGDCPEHGLHGLNETIQKSNYSSFIFYFSDAAVKEPGYASAIANAARKKNIKIWIIETGCCTGSCGVYAPYNQIANITGGVHFKIKKEEIPPILKFVNENVRCRDMKNLRYPPKTFSGIKTWLATHRECPVPTGPPPTLPPPMTGATGLTAQFLVTVMASVVVAMVV